MAAWPKVMSLGLLFGKSLSVVPLRRRARGSFVGCGAGLTFAAIACALLAPILEGQRAKPSEYQVKAVYLYNFARFVDWSVTAAAAKSDSFAVCVMGQDPFGAILDATLASELIDQRKVVAMRIARPQDASVCQVLFISSSEDARLREILPFLDKMKVLTVSDMPHFSERGGMIQFVPENDKIRFEVNLTNTERAGLSLSSELLRVAVVVRRNSQPGG